ncbi:MAG: DUF2802 domain-containing protein [Gammaproteobacteria bacterium]
MLSLLSLFLWVAGLIITTFILIAANKLYRDNQSLIDKVIEQSQRLTRLENDLAALCKASNGEGSHIVKLEQRVRGLIERQEILELRAQKNQPYSRASQLAHEGASIDDLVNGCGLSRAEAELVIMLHGPYGQG